MKAKILTIATVVALSFGVVNAQTTSPETKQTYAEFVKLNPEIKKLENHPEIKFETELDVKKMGALGYFLDTDVEPNSKFSFFHYVKPDVTFLNVKVRNKAVMVNKQTNKITGTLVEFEGEEAKNKFEEIFKKQFGQPVETVQQNADTALAWGYSGEEAKKDPKKKIVPIVLTYNMYTGLGAVIWGSPASFFKQ